MDTIEEEIIDLFTSKDSIIEHEFFVNNHKNNLGPEQSLMLSVLIEGINDFFSHKRSENHKDAAVWLQEDRETHLFSYISITNYFDISPILFREKLIKLRENRYWAKRKIKDINGVFTWDKK